MGGDGIRAVAGGFGVEDKGERTLQEEEIMAGGGRKAMIKKVAVAGAGVGVGIVGLNRLLQATPLHPQARVAVNLLVVAVALVSWWQTTITAASAKRDSDKSDGLREIWKPAVARVERKPVQLPFADHRFWNFIVFPKTYFLRKFASRDVVVFSVFVFMHTACLLAPFTFTWRALALCLGLHIITGMVGITFSFHRQLTHRSFSTPKWLEYLCAWIGCLALQGDPIEWCSAHRHHHVQCDTEEDPHSPFDGFFWSHMGWMWNERETGILQDTSNVPDLWRQPFYRFLRSTYPIHPTILAVALYLMGGLPFLIWGVAVRTVLLWHVTWLVNSASHVWGFQTWKTGDLSMNNWWVGLLAFGEGWHNNHHAFEDSARHGLEWWQIDVTWYLIRVLKLLGLADNVRLPSQKKMDKLRLAQ
uniref:Fatty acid desaturase domain-containing protein n=1 Tax=Compsopogon caeruleus TaxID=31354 RepID=A0A7S1TEW7_9RHOD